MDKAAESQLKDIPGLVRGMNSEEDIPVQLISTLLWNHLKYQRRTGNSRIGCKYSPGEMQNACNEIFFPGYSP